MAAPFSEISMEQRNRRDVLYQIWEVAKPVVIYLVTCQAALLLTLYLCNAAMEYFGEGLQGYIAGNAGTVTELVSVLSMLIGVVPLIPMFRRELAVKRDCADEMTLQGTADTGSEKAIQRLQAVLITVVLAASSSVGVNVLLLLTGLVGFSESYREVASQQYSVIFGVGVVLFGMIAPIVEEIVFRGLVFNRMRRYYPTMAAMVVSGALFGIYHGNLVQGVYGGCMGILLAYTYERMKSFLFPCLFHAAANLTVYMLTYAQTVYPGLQGVIITVPGCTMLLIVSAACIFVTERLWKR